MTVDTLDLRQLAPPEPMERILAAVESLQPGEALVALTPLYPAPLLAILQADGMLADVAAHEDGFCVRITRPVVHDGAVPDWEPGRS
ncbi:DUF2249 domain-containing protein [Lysobacter arvi]|uniref:DUF2249 domain-containing protein n=1 Tax=Lysobacter arvi TaxID=3038776 RepID=A0ABU1CE18_9GAMM|nr:DUF2249 domain-containing protein [Lysobacter arvi]MDR0183401.1 DUF2249 domain-containing protein [Lysobacter arvi]